MVNKHMGRLSISPDGHWFRTQKGKPFFWMGDTGWLMLIRLDLYQIEAYLKKRASQGFNVIQVMIIHRLGEPTIEGYEAVPSGQFGLLGQDERFWNKLDRALDLAGRLGLILALVPVWGSNVKNNRISLEEAAQYGKFLGQRYAPVPNIVWLNGGDVRGDENKQIWQTLGLSIKENDPDHLMTFHPVGQTDSSFWFHHEPWLDFNLFQSGHRRYGQLEAEGDYTYSNGLEEDNWRFVMRDFNLVPPKPTLDGEPSYEAIFQGLLNPNEPLWQDRDCRRYAWWSVLAGAAGHTYGHNAVMQMNDSAHPPAYGCKTYWADALNAPGASQMSALCRLIHCFESEQRRGLFLCQEPRYYQHFALMKGPEFILAYSYQGENIVLPSDLADWPNPLFGWYDPRLGVFSSIQHVMANENHITVIKPDRQDWTLVVTSPHYQKVCISHGIDGAKFLLAV